MKMDLIESAAPINRPTSIIDDDEREFDWACKMAVIRVCLHPCWETRFVDADADAGLTVGATPIIRLRPPL